MPGSDLPGDTGGDTGGGPDTGNPDPPDCGDLPADDAGYAALFDVSRLHTIVLTLPADQAAALEADPTTWAEAAATIDGMAFSSIGVKWRGDSDQMRWDGKPSWTLGLREASACDTLAGLDRLELDAMGDDPAQGRVVLEAAILAALGRQAPHVVYATVEADGEPLGLYALVERVDTNFVTHRYGAGGAALWRSDNGADFTSGGVALFKAEVGEADPAALTAVADVVAGAGPTFYADLGAVLDTEDLTAHWAALAAVGDLGAWPYETDDVDLVIPTGGALGFVADKPGSGWSVDYAWDRVDSALAVRCVYDAACAAAVQADLTRTVAQLATVDTAGLARAAFALTDAALADDPRRGTTLSAVHDARDSLAASLAAWPTTLRP